MENIKEFNDLIQRYETITLEEIQEEFQACDTIQSIYNNNVIALQLTGFGLINTCTLCVSVHAKCGLCVYKNDAGCIRNKRLYFSYYKIRDSKTPEQLLKAYRNRAKILRTYAKDNKIPLTI